MFPEAVETEALVLRKLAPDHVDPFALYDPFREDAAGVADVFEYVPQEPYATVREARDQLAEAASAWDDRDAAQYAVYAGDDLAGYTGLFLEWERRSGRLGCTLARRFWGRGYAVECALALTEVAFERLDLDLVAVGHEAGNERSERAIRTYVDRVGGRKDGVLRNWTPVGDDVVAHHRYTVTRDEYEAATGE